MKTQIILIFLVALGVVARWLFHLVETQKKVIKKKGDKFDWEFYIQDNGATMLLTVVCSVALYLIAPIVLEYFELKSEWGKAFAFGCGMTSLEIVRVFRSLLMKKITEKTGESTEEPKN